MNSLLPRLEAHLRENAERYYPELGGAELRVECFATREGPLSVIHRLRLRAGDAERRLVAKLPPSRARSSTQGAEPARPRVTPLQDPAVKHRSEHDALCAVEQHLKAIGDPRFRAVRVLDFVESEQALLMEEIPGRALTHWVARAHRLRLGRGLPELASLFESLGAWLRAYHALPPLDHTRAVNTTREQVIRCVQDLARFLERAHPQRRVLQVAAARIETLAVSLLPPELPLGTHHGDLAPRNVIVGADARVTVLDTRAAWRAPIYEDIAYFLTAARTPRFQAASLGLALGRGALDRLEDAFLRGYFVDEPAPLARVRLFELQAILDKWAARTDDRPPARGLARWTHAYRDWSVDRWLERSTARVLAQLGAAEDAA